MALKVGLNHIQTRLDNLERSSSSLTPEESHSELCKISVEFGKILEQNSENLTPTSMLAPQMLMGRIQKNSLNEIPISAILANLK